MVWNKKPTNERTIWPRNIQLENYLQISMCISARSYFASLIMIHVVESELFVLRSLLCMLFFICVLLVLLHLHIFFLFHLPRPSLRRWLCHSTVVHNGAIDHGKWKIQFLLYAYNTNFHLRHIYAHCNIFIHLAFVAG